MVMTISTIHYWHPAASSLPQFSQSEGFNQIINRSSKKLSLDGLCFSLRWRILVMQFREETKRHQKICDIVSNKMVVYLSSVQESWFTHFTHSAASCLVQQLLQFISATITVNTKVITKLENLRNIIIITDDHYLQRSSEPAV